MNMVRKIALLIALALFFALPAQAKPGVVEFLDPNCTPTPEPGRADSHGHDLARGGGASVEI